MGEPARKLPPKAADPFDGLDAVDPGVDPFEGLDAAPVAPARAPAAPSSSRDEAFDSAVDAGEPLRTRGRDIAAELGTTKTEAAVRGLGSGATLRHGDEAAGFGAWLASHFPGGSGDAGTLSMSDMPGPIPGDVPRAAGRGAEAPLSPTTDYTAARNVERDANAQAQEHHPYVFGAAEVAGAAAPALALHAAGVPVTAGMSPVGAAALEGGALGAVGGEGASEAETPGGVLRDAAIGGVTGAGSAALLTAGAPIVAEGVKKGAGKVGGVFRGAEETMHDVATEQRLAGAGVERGGMKKLREKPGGLERYAEGADRLEIGKGRMLPSTVRQHAEDAAAAADKAGAAKDAIVAQLNDQGATVHGADIGAAIRKLKSEHGAGVGRQLEEIASEFDAMGEMPWAAANLERKDWGASTAFDSGSVRAKLSKKVYGRINEAMADSAERVEPGSGKAWRSANEDEHIALKLAEMGENKLNQAGNRALSPTDYAAGAAGTVAQGPIVGVGAALANKALRSREHAAASNLARGAESVMGALGSAAEHVSSAAGDAATSMATRIASESAGAAAATRASSAVDRATTDGVYGSMLAAQPQGQARDVVYSTLLIQDPAFRERERLRAQKQTEEKEN